MWTGTQLEQHWTQVQMCDCHLRGLAFRRQLFQRGTDEHAQTLIRSANYGRAQRRGVIIQSEYVRVSSPAPGSPSDARDYSSN
jgi:hypothetical protein